MQGDWLQCARTGYTTWKHFLMSVQSHEASGCHDNPLDIVLMQISNEAVIVYERYGELMKVVGFILTEVPSRCATFTYVTCG